jgi:hypothetical protein
MFKQGKPYVQIIPFKRESWKAAFDTVKNNNKNKFNYLSSLLNAYKDKIWFRKKWD